MVRVLSFGPRKIEAIKLVRGLTGLGLKDAKDLVESAPFNLPADDPAEVAARLRDAGMTVEVSGEAEASAPGPTANGDGPFCVRATGVGNRKIQVIKIIRDVSHLDLRGAKDLADAGEFEVGES